MKEIWVKSYCSDRHLVSNKGRIKKLAYTTESGRRFKEGICKVSKSSGYDRVSILGKSIRVHQLVYFSFNGGNPNETELVIDHINGDKSDNRLENLELVTIKENLNRARRMKDTKKRTLVTVMNHKGFNKNYATLGNVRLSVTEGDTFREHLLESTEDWVETDSNGCISTLEVFREPKPFTADFIIRNKKVEDVPNYDLLNIIRENITDDRVKPLLEEFLKRYNDEQRKVYEFNKDHCKYYTEQDLVEAMKFAVHDITGRKLRDTVLETMVEDFIDENND